MCNNFCTFSQGGMGVALLSDPDRIESVSITLWILNCLEKYYILWCSTRKGNECIQEKFVKARIE